MPALQRCSTEVTIFRQLLSYSFFSSCTGTDYSCVILVCLNIFVLVRKWMDVLNWDLHSVRSTISPFLTTAVRMSLPAEKLTPAGTLIECMFEALPHWPRSIFPPFSFQCSTLSVLDSVLCLHVLGM